MAQQRQVLETQHTEQRRSLLQRLADIGLNGRKQKPEKLLDSLDEHTPREVIVRKAALHFLRARSRSEAPVDQEALSEAFDWATDKLASIAIVAQESVANKRALLRDISLNEQRINNTQAQTARTLEKLISG